MLNRREKREGKTLAEVEPRLWIRVREQGVGIRLQPVDSRERRRIGVAPGREEQHARLPPEGVQARIRRDPVEPAAKRRAFPEPVKSPPRAKHRLLDEILGVVERADHPVAVHLELPAVRPGQLGERVLVPAPRGGEQWIAA
jgi:hypothetical protein